MAKRRLHGKEKKGISINGVTYEENDIDRRLKDANLLLEDLSLDQKAEYMKVLILSENEHVLVQGDNSMIDSAKLHTSTRILHSPATFETSMTNRKIQDDVLLTPSSPAHISTKVVHSHLTGKSGSSSPVHIRTKVVCSHATGKSGSSKKREKPEVEDEDETNEGEGMSQKKRCKFQPLDKQHVTSLKSSTDIDDLNRLIKASKSKKIGPKRKRALVFSDSSLDEKDTILPAATKNQLRDSSLNEECTTVPAATKDQKGSLIRKDDDAILISDEDDKSNDEQSDKLPTNRGEVNDPTSKLKKVDVTQKQLVAGEANTESQQDLFTEDDSSSDSFKTSKEEQHVDSDAETQDPTEDSTHSSGGGDVVRITERDSQPSLVDHCTQVSLFSNNSVTESHSISAISESDEEDQAISKDGVEILKEDVRQPDGLTNDKQKDTSKAEHGKTKFCMFAGPSDCVSDYEDSYIPLTRRKPRKRPVTHETSVMERTLLTHAYVTQLQQQSRNHELHDLFQHPITVGRCQNSLDRIPVDPSAILRDARALWGRQAADKVYSLFECRRLPVRQAAIRAAAQSKAESSGSLMLAAVAQSSQLARTGLYDMDDEPSTSTDLPGAVEDPLFMAYNPLMRRNKQAAKSRENIPAEDAWKRVFEPKATETEDSPMEEIEDDDDDDYEPPGKKNKSASKRGRGAGAITPVNGKRADAARGQAGRGRGQRSAEKKAGVSTVTKRRGQKKADIKKQTGAPYTGIFTTCKNILKSAFGVLQPREPGLFQTYSDVEDNDENLVIAAKKIPESAFGVLQPREPGLFQTYSDVEYNDENFVIAAKKIPEVEVIPAEEVEDNDNSVFGHSQPGTSFAGTVLRPYAQARLESQGKDRSGLEQNAEPRPDIPVTPNQRNPVKDLSPGSVRRSNMVTTGTGLPRSIGTTPERTLTLTIDAGSSTIIVSSQDDGDSSFSSNVGDAQLILRPQMSPKSDENVPDFNLNSARRRLTKRRKDRFNTDTEDRPQTARMPEPQGDSIMVGTEMYTLQEPFDDKESAINEADLADSLGLCPVCGKNFPLAVIETHASGCGESQIAQTQQPRPTRNRLARRGIRENQTENDKNFLNDGGNDKKEDNDWTVDLEDLPDLLIEGPPPRPVGRAGRGRRETRGRDRALRDVYDMNEEELRPPRRATRQTTPTPPPSEDLPLAENEEACPVCGEIVPLSLLQNHVNACLDRQGG